MHIDNTPIEEVPTSELVEELRRRSDTSVILLSVLGEGGARDNQFFHDGDVIMRLGLVAAMQHSLKGDLQLGDLDNED
jgi:hypothetical protein